MFIFYLKYECKSFKVSKPISVSNDQIIDYCNYLLQTHFRLANVFKLTKQREQFDYEGEKQKSKLNERLLGLIYNVLTDSLALMAASLFDEDRNDDHEKKSKWNELFVENFKNVKKSLKQNSNSNNKSMSFESTSTSYTLEITNHFSYDS
jgi:hypothetical protein